MTEIIHFVILLIVGVILFAPLIWCSLRYGLIDKPLLKIEDREENNDTR